MYKYSLSLPFCLVETIYSYIPTHELYYLSKSYFNTYINAYFNNCKLLKNNRFYQNKINNTYIRYLIRNDMDLFIQYIVSSRLYTPWTSIKRYYYKNNMYKTYLDYCIYLSNEYESEKTKHILSCINNKGRKSRQKHRQK